MHVEQGRKTLLTFLRQMRDNRLRVEDNVLVAEQLLALQPNDPLPRYLRDLEETCMQELEKTYG